MNNDISKDYRLECENKSIYTRQRNKKYQDFYQFIVKQEINENTNMEVREYNEQDAKIMLMFLQNLIPNNKDTKLIGVCNTTTYSLKKGILNNVNKGR